MPRSLFNKQYTLWKDPDADLYRFQVGKRLPVPNAASDQDLSTILMIAESGTIA